SALPRFLPGGGEVSERRAASELDQDSRVVLPAVLVEGARLVGVFRVILERRIVEVERVERQGKVVVDLVLQRCRQYACVILELRRAAIQTDEEMRAVGVRDARAEAVVLVIAHDVV